MTASSRDIQLAGEKMARYLEERTKGRSTVRRTKPVVSAPKHSRICATRGRHPRRNPRRGGVGFAREIENRGFGLILPLESVSHNQLYKS